MFLKKHFTIRLFFCLFTACAAVGSLQGQDVKSQIMALNDIAFNPATGRIYGVAPAGQPDGNSIVVIHPNTGLVERRIPVGSEPAQILVSENGQRLYVGLDGAPLIRRFNLVADSFEDDIVLLGAQNFDLTRYDMALLPGQADALVVALRDPNLYPGFGGIVIFDGTTPRPNAVPSSILGGESIVVTNNGQRVYGFSHDYQTSGGLYRYTVDAQGIQHQQTFSTLLPGQYYRIEQKANIIYSERGHIIKVTGGAPTQTGKIDIGETYGYRQNLIEPAPDSNHLYFFNFFNTTSPFELGNYFLKTYDASTFQFIRQVKIPIDQVSGDLAELIHLGGSGSVAILTKFSVPSQATGRLIIVRGNCPTPPLAANLSIQFSKNISCAGDSIELEAAAGGGFSNYFWSDGQLGKKIKVSANFATSKTIWYRAMDASGCLSANSDSVKLTFENPPKIVFQSFFSPLMICQGSSATITVLFELGSGTVHWSNGAVGPSASFDKAGDYSAYAINDKNGCRSNTLHFKIVVANSPPPDKPTVEIDGPNPNCENQPVIVRTAHGFAKIEWSNGWDLAAFQVQSTKNYRVRVADGLGCFSPWSDWVSVKIEKPLPQPIISKVGVNLLRCDYTFGDRQWFLNGNPIPGATGIQITATQSGFYSIRATKDICTSPMSPLWVFTKECEAEIFLTNLAPGSAVLKAAPSPDLTPDYLYQWSNGQKTDSIIITQPGNYCVTITAPSGCRDTACMTVVNLAPVSISVLQPSGSPAGASPVVLYKTKQQSGQFEAFDTVMTNLSGLAYFPAVPAGEYLAKALPHASQNQFAPTYLGKVLLWDEATRLNIPTFSPTNGFGASIQFFEKNVSSGGGSIEGKVIEGANFSDPNDDRGPGDPVEGVSILVFDVADQIVAAAQTDVAGVFLIKNLSFGKYQVFLDIPGLEPVFREVEISPAAPTFQNLIFLTDEDSAAVPTSTPSASAEGLQVFPNPAHSDFWVQVPAAGRLRIFDLQGKLIFEKWTQRAGLHSFTAEIWPVGVYFLHFQKNEGLKPPSMLLIKK